MAAADDTRVMLMRVPPGCTHEQKTRNRIAGDYQHHTMGGHYRFIRALRNPPFPRNTVFFK